MQILSFMHHIPLRSQLMAAFVAPAIIVLLSASAVYINLETVMKRSQEVERGISAIAVRGDLLRSVLEAESGERGYVITGNPEFLEPYDDAVIEFYRLSNIWREDAGQSELRQLETIENLFNQWLNEVARPVIAAREQAPGRLVSRGFDALYHISYLGDVLAYKAELPEANIDEFVNELLDNIRMASKSAQLTANADKWAFTAAKTKRLIEIYPLAIAASLESDIRVNALNLSEELFMEVRDLTHDAVEAEDSAIDVISSGAGKSIVDAIRAEISQSILFQKNLLRESTGKSQTQIKIAEWAAITLPIVGMGLGMLILYLLQFGTLKSIMTLRNCAGAVARGELDVRIEDNRSDELGALAHSFNQMAEELQVVYNEKEMMDGLQSMLVSSESEAEAYGAARRVCNLLLPGLSGTFYATAASRNLTQAVESWGNNFHSADVFNPSDCRALRVGQIHCASIESAEVFCDHLDKNTLKASACIPMMSKDETLGCLSIFRADEGDKVISSNELALAKTITNRLALTLSNLRLAEKLRAQSIRDPLTGLFNRRYLEETLEREIARVNREKKTLSIIALDADHFKRLNDEFSHEAGDLVLKALSEQMQSIVRDSDIACRVGGEEFLLVLPEASGDIAVQRAEDLRRRVESLDLSYQGRSLGKITISLGVATLLKQSIDQLDLLRKADLALYEAKNQGRNRVVRASQGS